MTRGGPVAHMKDPPPLAGNFGGYRPTRSVDQPAIGYKRKAPRKGVMARGFESQKWEESKPHGTVRQE